MEQGSNEVSCCNHTQKLRHGRCGELEGMCAGQQERCSAAGSGVYSTDACHSAGGLYLPRL